MPLLLHQTVGETAALLDTHFPSISGQSEFR